MTSLGQSQSNLNVGNSGDRLARVFRRINGLPTRMPAAEIEGDNAEIYFLRFCRWVATTPIPVRFTDDLLPVNDDSKRCCTTNTLAQYIGQHLKAVRLLHPNHPDWQQQNTSRSPDGPLWWPSMRDAFMKESQRFQLTISGDVIFGDTKTRPLYMDNGNGLLQDDSLIQDYIGYIDLKYILRKLVCGASISGNQKLQQRCWLGITNSAIGRGGEIKFQDYNEWLWHPKFEVTDIRWTELKRLAAYAMPMVPHKAGGWELDFYHQLACYYAIENGLHRSEKEIEDGLLNVVFPDLHQLQDSSVTTKLSTIIRQNLPAGCPSDIQKSYSAKST